MKRRLPIIIAVLLILGIARFLFAPSKNPLQAEAINVPGEHTLKFAGGVFNPPADLKARPYSFRYRVYYCPPEALKRDEHDHKTPPDCLLRYHGTSSSSADGSIDATLRVDKNWTHAFVELRGIEEIKGRYSPGHNPYWFKNTGADTLRHEFRFESQENPIPDAIQEKLAAKFAPIIALKKDKRYIPTNLEQYHKRYKHDVVPAKWDDWARLRDDVSDEPYLTLPEPSTEPGATHLYYHVRPANTVVSGTQPEALPGWRDDTNYRYLPSKNRVVSYWIWYDHNAGPTSYGNVHQGDLESFAVLVDENDQPLRFMTTGHDHIMLDTAWTNINSVNHHPIIYIAHGNKGADGGNPTSAYGGFTVFLDAGNGFFNWLTDPRDIFPALDSEDTAVILPADLDGARLKTVRLGPGEWIDKSATRSVDLSGRVLRKITRLVKWEEPGWINHKADRDPDGHHRVDEESADFLKFPGRLGRHPRSNLKVLALTKYGESPKNAPFKTNIEQHYTFESPREDRFHTARKGHYGPRWKGDAKTPQILE